MEGEQDSLLIDIQLKRDLWSNKSGKHGLHKLHWFFFFFRDTTSHMIIHGDPERDFAIYGHLLR